MTSVSWMSKNVTNLPHPPPPKRNIYIYHKYFTCYFTCLHINRSCVLYGDHNWGGCIEKTFWNHFKGLRLKVQWKTVEMSLIEVNKTYLAYAGKWTSRAFHVSTVIMFTASSSECSIISRTDLAEEAFHDMTWYDITPRRWHWMNWYADRMTDFLYQ